MGLLTTTQPTSSSWLRKGLWTLLMVMVGVFIGMNISMHTVAKKKNPHAEPQKLGILIESLVVAYGNKLDDRPLEAIDLSVLFDTCTSNKTALLSNVADETDPLYAVSRELHRECSRFGRLHSKQELTYRVLGDSARSLANMYAYAQQVKKYGDINAKVSCMEAWQEFNRDRWKAIKERCGSNM